METKQTIENIKETFVVGLKGIIKISGFFKDIWKYKVSRYSIIISILTPIVSSIFKVDNAALLCEIQSQMIVFLPCILGFTIAGYALVVGFVQSNMINKITEPAKDTNFSLYQLMSSKFAMNVILQGVSLVFAYLYHFIIYFNSNSKLNLQFSNCYISSVNIIGLILLSFWFTISVLLVIQIVINIFNFSQLHHYFINIGKVRDKEL
ncbi:MAG: hypothetical protein JWR50_4190 [Mucilaginibacter sp.]|nr:hypothetical protein [Mucilaginibacter sp.]